MTRRWLFGMLVCCGCGRFDFDEKVDPPLVEEKKAPTLSYPESINAVKAVTMVDVEPQFEGEGITFTVSPPLPAGVTLDAVTGKIQGIPQAAEQRVPHIVTATNEGGSASATILFTSLTGAVVNRFADQPDLDEGMNDKCEVAEALGGGCTLRAAFDTANHLAGQPQLVVLSAGEYVLDGSLSGLKQSIVIAGAGAGKTIIRPSGNYPMIYVDSGPTLRLENLTVTGFKSSDGGALRVSRGALEVFNVSFEGNEAVNNSGGVLCIDGGASADFESATFSGNKAVNGNGWGGVINGAGLGTRISVRRSTATGNVAQWGSFAHLETGASLLLENSTLTGNTAGTAGTLASPGGLYTLTNVTIVNNNVLAANSAGIYLHGGTAHYTLANTIVAQNLDKNGDQNNCNRNDPNTTLQSMGGNLFGDDAGNCGGELDAAGDVMRADPKLDPKGLAANGGPTRTVALQPGSSAIDRGTTACPKRDQRGVARTGATCDAGAFELP